MHRTWLIVAVVSLAIVLIGIVVSSQITRHELTPIESAAVAEQKLLQRRGARSDTTAITVSRQQLPGPFPSEPVPVMREPDPRGMDSDLVKKQFHPIEGVQSIPEEPEPSQQR